MLKFFRYTNFCVSSVPRKQVLCQRNFQLKHLTGYLRHECANKTMQICCYSSKVDSCKNVLFGKTYTPEMTKQEEKLLRAMDIFIQGHEMSVLTSFMTFMCSAAEHLNITVAGELEPKFIADRSTFLKSIHIFKKHRVQYETRTYRKVLQLKYITGSTANVYLEYVQRNVPAGVTMQVHKWQLERIPEHIRKEMKKNISEMTKEDWDQASKFIHKMKEERKTNELDYQEYHTTKRFLLGTVM